MLQRPFSASVDSPFAHFAFARFVVASKNLFPVAVSVAGIRMSRGEM